MKNDIKLEKIIRKAYLRILPVQILSIVISAINTLVDNIVTGRYLGSEAIAAIGFFAPVTTVIGISYVLIIGIQILCSKHLGRGEGDKVVSVFSTGFITLTMFSILITIVTIIFNAPLAHLLGARGSTAELLEKYIIGYSFGIIGQILSGMLMVFMPLNNYFKRSYVGIGVMISTNILFDFALIRFGVLGMGLATAISYLASCIVMLTGFFDKEKAIHFKWGNFCFNKIPKAIILGLPGLMFTVGCTLKGYIMNNTLMNTVGNSAVAAMNVQGNICSILGSIPQGSANAFMVLASMYYGEQDRESMTAVMRYAIKVGLILSVIAMSLLMICSGIIPSMFFKSGDEAWAVTQRMLLLFPSFLVLNTLFNLFMKVYHCQGKTLLVNILSVSENLIMGLISITFAGIIGADAVWLSFPASEIICIMVIGVSVMLFAKKLTFRLQDWMKLGKDFGASEDEFVEFVIESMDDVINVSEKVIEFCKKHNIDNKRGMYAGLSVEEMAGNVVQHGFVEGEKHSLEIRIVAKDSLTIRLRDDCPSFNPKQRLEQYEAGEDISKNIGIRMIAKLSEEMSYQNSVGINTLLIKI